MKKIKQIFLLLIFLLPCSFLFGACSLLEEKVYVTGIQQTSVFENQTTYTVYYSNGTTSLFTVENGKDGENGADLTIESIKEYCTQNNIDFETFLKQYLTVVDETESIQQATATAIQSAVSVWCEFPSSNYYNIKKNSLACGAGVIYQMNDTYSYIITNYHVVYYTECNTPNKIAKKINIFQYGTSEIVYDTQEKDQNGYPIYGYGDGAVEAEYVGGAMNYDIAVLKVKTADLLKYNEHAKAVTIAEDYQIAETAIAIGNPEMEGISVTSGIISVESENIVMTGADDVTKCKFRVMRIDVAVNGGNSGGGLFNINGELIGIVNAKVVDNTIENIAYALPHGNVTAVADNVIYHYEQNGQPSNVLAAFLNVEFVAENARSIYNPTTKETKLKEDIIVNSVSLKNNNNGIGLGYSIGLQTGDKVKAIQINDTVHTLDKMYQLGDLLLTIKPGDKFMLILERNLLETKVGITTEEGIILSQLTEIK